MYEYPDCVLFWLILCTHIINWELLRRSDAVKKSPIFSIKQPTKHRTFNFIKRYSIYKGIKEYRDIFL